ncbi:hypothetical protein Ciccas_006213 [Cichlidogyrus casuarinus]|uniref:Uncharacterized protein n=1 Tax=Cichlidogyrus casuarinus TaxID=1844966 RepID=A0ABD2Q6E5_9PLAT
MVEDSLVQIEALSLMLVREESTLKRLSEVMIVMNRFLEEAAGTVQRRISEAFFTRYDRQSNYSSLTLLNFCVQMQGDLDEIVYKDSGNRAKNIPTECHDLLGYTLKFFLHHFPEDSKPAQANQEANIDHDGEGYQPFARNQAMHQVASLEEELLGARRSNLRTENDLGGTTCRSIIHSCVKQHNKVPSLQKGQMFPSLCFSAQLLKNALLIHHLNPLDVRVMIAFRLLEPIIRELTTRIQYQISFISRKFVYLEHRIMMRIVIIAGLSIDIHEITVTLGM